MPTQQAQGQCLPATAATDGIQLSNRDSASLPQSQHDGIKNNREASSHSSKSAAPVIDLTADSPPAAQRSKLPALCTATRLQPSPAVVAEVMVTSAERQHARPARLSSASQDSQSRGQWSPAAMEGATPGAAPQGSSSRIPYISEFSISLRQRGAAVQRVLPGCHRPPWYPVATLQDAYCCVNSHCVDGPQICRLGSRCDIMTTFDAVSSSQGHAGVYKFRAIIKLNKLTDMLHRFHLASQLTHIN